MLSVLQIHIFFIGIATSLHFSLAEFAHGKYNNLINVGNSLCLQSNPNHFRAEVGVFLGQVTLEECDYDNDKQKWGVILWAKENSTLKTLLLVTCEWKREYWFYPMENGLNELSAVLNEDAVYPVNNFIEVTEVVVKDGKSTDVRFVFKSIEFNQCAASQGKSNPITYEYCDVKSRDQQWKMKVSNDEPLDKVLTTRTLYGMTRDLLKFTLQQFIS